MKQVELIFLLFFSTTLQSQTLEGKVYDSETKQPLEFVNVFFKKTTYGTFTNDKGEFKLDFSNENDTLYFSTIGYKIQKFRISDIVSTKEFYLAETKKKLDEIVLLGEKLEYASSKK
ncbi:carboxypeptidase-like regulatory domain-containing protein [Flavobacterium haoranii]|nr:carboxypeptidase-like regulatory domain-containing protein [Flavobacterium haoranii]